ncbi:hypothetical protein ACA910_005701 [Epithemia clementina (nom. ined.)]
MQRLFFLQSEGNVPGCSHSRQGQVAATLHLMGKARLVLGERLKHGGKEPNRNSRADSDVNNVGRPASTSPATSVSCWRFVWYGNGMCNASESLVDWSNANQIQFKMARKMWAAVSNFIHTTPHGVGASTIRYGERGSQFFSGSPTNSQGFKRFMSGCPQQMGNVWVPNKAVTLEEILPARDILDEEYGSLEPGHRQLEVALTGSLLVCRYTAALWGEELPLINIGMICKHWDEGKNYAHKPHIPLALIGRFKQTNRALSSGIHVQQWIGQTIEYFHQLRIMAGPMFQTVTKSSKPQCATVSHLDKRFYNILKWVQLR